MAEPTDDKNSEHGARTGFAAGHFGTPEVPDALPGAGFAPEEGEALAGAGLLEEAARVALLGMKLIRWTTALDLVARVQPSAVEAMLPR